MTARDQFRLEVAQALTDWRLDCIPPRSNWDVERELFRAGIAEILALRLRVAYIPLLQGLQRIEARVNILVNLREDPYAPPPRPTAVLMSKSLASRSEHRYPVPPEHR